MSQKKALGEMLEALFFYYRKLTNAYNDGNLRINEWRITTMGMVHFVIKFKVRSIILYPYEEKIDGVKEAFYSIMKDYDFDISERYEHNTTIGTYPAHVLTWNCVGSLKDFKKFYEEQNDDDEAHELAPRFMVEIRTKSLII